MPRSLHAAQCSLTVPFPLNSLWGTGTARSRGFSRGNRLRSFEHIGSSRSAKSPARAPAVAESGPFSDVSVDLHGVKTPGETTHALDQNLRRRIFCGKLLPIARCRSKDSSGQSGAIEIARAAPSPDRDRCPARTPRRAIAAEGDWTCTAREESTGLHPKTRLEARPELSSNMRPRAWGNCRAPAPPGMRTVLL